VEEHGAQNSFDARGIPGAEVLAGRFRDRASDFIDVDKLEIKQAITGEIEVTDAFLSANFDGVRAQGGGNNQPVGVGIILPVLPNVGNRFANQARLAIGFHLDNQSSILASYTNPG